jgi:type IV pilus assembly protein PilM
MKLLNKKKNDSVVGLEFDSGSVAAAEAPSDGIGPVPHAGVQRLPAGAVRDGEVIEIDDVAAALAEMFDRDQLPKRVRLGVANQHVVFRTLQLPPIEDPKQLNNAVRFMAQEQIPMPLEAAVLDHQVIGVTAGEDGNRQVNVAVVAARKEMVASLLEPVKRAGLDPVGIDLTAFGMIRALASSAIVQPEAHPETGPEPEAFVQATLYCSLGDVTNLAVARDRACLFARVAEFGVRQISERLVAEQGLLPEHADQWLLHVGLEMQMEQVEGAPDVIAATRRTMEDGALRLADELRLSIDSYAAQEGAISVGSIVLCGWGSAIPGLRERLMGELGRTVSVGRPAALTGLSDSFAGRLAIPYGLGLEN